MNDEPLSITEAVDSGTRRDQLIALRAIVAAAVGDASPRDLAPLTRRLIELTTEIEALDDADEIGGLIPDEPWTPGV